VHSHAPGLCPLAAQLGGALTRIRATDLCTAEGASEAQAKQL